MPFQSRNTKRFAESVDPGDSVSLTRSFDYAATVEEVDVRFYKGAENSVEIEVYRVSNGDRMSLVDLEGRDVIVGDDDYFQFDTVEQITPGDSVEVIATNTGDHTYDFAVDVTIDRLAGASRVMSGLRGVFSP